MKIQEIKKMTKPELQDKLSELQNKKLKLQFSIANNQLKNVRELREVKKNIARILTTLKNE